MFIIFQGQAPRSLSNLSAKTLKPVPVHGSVVSIDAQLDRNQASHSGEVFVVLVSSLHLSGLNVTAEDQDLTTEKHWCHLLVLIQNFITERKNPKFGFGFGKYNTVIAPALELNFLFTR